MITLIVAAALCPYVKIENRTDYPWNTYDTQTVYRAKSRCMHLYEESPCLRRFYKVGPMDYVAYCGKFND